MELTFGQKIKNARIAKHLTQKQLAEKIKAKHNSISDWENNKNKPDPDTIELLCGILEITPNYLLNTTISEMTYSPKENNIIRRYRDLDDYGKEAVDSILDIEHKRYLKTKIIEKERLAIANKVKETSKSHTCIPETRIYPEGVLPIDSYQTEDDEDDTRISMPVYDLGASAGTGVFLDNPCYEMVSVPEDRLSRKANFALWVSGNSMEPRFHNGDLVLVKIQPAVEIGEIGIFILNGEGYIKKWGGDKLISLNNEYDPIEIGENDTLYCKGKVIGNA